MCQNSEYSDIFTFINIDYRYSSWSLCCLSQFLPNTSLKVHINLPPAEGDSRRAWIRSLLTCKTGNFKPHQMTRLFVKMALLFSCLTKKPQSKLKNSWINDHIHVVECATTESWKVKKSQKLNKCQFETYFLCTKSANFAYMTMLTECMIKSECCINFMAWNIDIEVSKSLFCIAPTPPSIICLLAAYHSNSIFTSLVKPTSWPISAITHKICSLIGLLIA